ncbi:TolC family outer membrane protein [Marivita sp. XM-24bin2]|jgi:outer membrane protein|uniref:TolC family outer membrane protein n=1 Tax=unclassified Marivita TaxID=2632480 RepID=UPI000D7A74B3|nr:TolC family outer membrane protein [Marivita sp. XM-24bin2]MCR9111463.1 TolC family outer membrane protein [Paracoccaceae bacterium]PWL33837.1 MAG: transporter [Marivita sp. XM-24bin2]
MAKRMKLTGLAVVFGLVISAPMAKAETLADAMIGAYNSSGLLEQNRAVLRAADEDVAQAVAALRPVISWSADATRQFGTTRSASTGNVIVPTVSNTVSASLIAELTLFDNGQSKLSIETAKEAVLATRQQLVSVEQQVLLSAVEAYLEVRRAIENVALRQNNVRLITQELRAARERFEVGEVTRTDTSLAEARLAAARSQLAAAEGALTVAREQYLAIVGRLPGGLQPLRGLPALPGSVESAKSIAVRNHPQVRSVQHQVAAAELNILRAEAAMKPTVRLSGRLTVTEGADTDRFTRGGSIGLEAGGPIYQGGRLTSLVRQAMANRDSARGQLHQVIDQVTQNVGNAYAQLRIAQASLESTERQVRAATVAFRGVREEAALGARTTLDVLNAEQELLNARSARISAQVDESIAAYRVLSTLGRLTATDLQLNVQQYDPVSYYNLVKESPIQKSKQGQQLDRVLKSLGKN